MQLPNVNILAYAHREDSLHHKQALEWMEKVINSDTAFAMSELVLSGFLRIAMHPKIFNHPQPSGRRINFC